MVFDLLFLWVFAFWKRGLNHTSAWAKMMQGTLMKVFKPPLNFF